VRWVLPMRPCDLSARVGLADGRWPEAVNPSLRRVPVFWTAEGGWGRGWRREDGVFEIEEMFVLPEPSFRGTNVHRAFSPVI